MIITSQASLEVCRLYNQLSECLLQSDSILIARWHSTISSAHTALSLPLLVQDNTIRNSDTVPHRLRVNFKQRLMQIIIQDFTLLVFSFSINSISCLPYCSLLDVIAESKALTAAGLPLPDVAQSILDQV